MYLKRVLSRCLAKFGPGFFQVIKYDIYDNANEHFDFNARGGNRFGSWASINQPRT
jgi:hypothetical protein